MRTEGRRKKIVRKKYSCSGIKKVKNEINCSNRCSIVETSFNCWRLLSLKRLLSIELN